MGGPPRSEQASGVWVEVGRSEEIIKRQLLLYPNTPLESWGAERVSFSRPLLVLKGPAKSRRYWRFQRDSGVPESLGVQRVSGVQEGLEGFRRSGKLQRILEGFRDSVEASACLLSSGRSLELQCMGAWGVSI